MPYSPFHKHTVCDYYTMLELVLKRPLSSQHKKHLSSFKQNIKVIDRMVNQELLRIEQSTISYYDCLQVIDQEIEEGHLLSTQQSNYLDKLRNTARIHQYIDYEKIFDYANQLRPYTPKIYCTDVVNLIFALEIGAEFLVTVKSSHLKIFLENKATELFSYYPRYRYLDIFDPASLAEWIKNNDLDNMPTIRVLTASGEEKELPEGSTVIDFAYKISPHIANKCHQAFVNNQNVPLDTILQQGDKINLVTDEQLGQPQKEWLQFVITEKAKQEIKKWFRRHHINRGKTLVNQEFGSTYQLYGHTLESVAKSLNCKNPDELYEALGKYDIPIEKVRFTLQAYLNRYEVLINFTSREATSNQVINSPILGADTAINHYKICQACQPFSDDVSEIIGIIKTNKKTTTLHIHHFDCQQIQKVNPDHKMVIQWSDDCHNCTAQLKIKMRDREGILKNILESLSSWTRYNIRIVTPVHNLSPDKIAVAVINILVSSKDQLDSIVLKLRGKPDILQVQITKITPGETHYQDD